MVVCRKCGVLPHGSFAKFHGRPHLGCQALHSHPTKTGWHAFWKTARLKSGKLQTHFQQISRVECKYSTNAGLTRALQRTAAPLGSWTVQVICQRLLQPSGRFRRRSLSSWSLDGSTHHESKDYAESVSVVRGCLHRRHFDCDHLWRFSSTCPASGV